MKLYSFRSHATSPITTDYYYNTTPHPILNNLPPTNSLDPLAARSWPIDAAQIDTRFFKLPHQLHLLFMSCFSLLPLTTFRCIQSSLICTKRTSIIFFGYKSFCTACHERFQRIMTSEAGSDDEMFH